jgi:alpha-N-acetylglucosaminidase
MPEGINNNAVVYDLVLKMAWHDQPVDVHEWIKQYAAYRYGVADPHLEKGWELLLRSVYSTSDSFNILGPVESVFLAKPSLRVQSVSTWGVTDLYYDPEILKRAANEFLSVADKYWDQPGFRYDVVDICRQLLSANGKMKYDEIVGDYKRGDAAELTKDKNSFLEMLLQMDSVCSIHEGFTLGRWLNEAKARGHTEEEKKQFGHNAKVQISYWGPVDSTSSLTDYANKQWSGMLRTYYYQRWQPYLDSLTERVRNKQPASLREPAIDFYSMGLRWADDHQAYDTVSLVSDPVPWLKGLVSGLD